jgi:hypothetical protein
LNFTEDDLLPKELFQNENLIPEIKLERSVDEGCRKEIDLEELYSKVNKKDRKNKDKTEESPDKNSSWGPSDDCGNRRSSETTEKIPEVDPQTPPPLPPRPASLSSPGTPLKPTQVSSNLGLGIVGGFKPAKSMSHDYQDISGSDECCVTFRFETTGCAKKSSNDSNTKHEIPKSMTNLPKEIHPPVLIKEDKNNDKNMIVEVKPPPLEILQAPLAKTDPKRILDRDDSAIIIDDEPVSFNRSFVDQDSGFNEAGLVEAVLVEVAEFDEEDDYDCFPSFLANADVVRPFGSDVLSAITEEEKVLYSKPVFIRPKYFIFQFPPTMSRYNTKTISNNEVVMMVKRVRTLINYLDIG